MNINDRINLVLKEFSIGKKKEAYKKLKEILSENQKNDQLRFNIAVIEQSLNLNTEAKNNYKKVSVNGCPRIVDFIVKKNYSKKPRNILFLPFDIRRGIPKISKNKNLNFKISLNKVIEILNELSENKNLKIIAKYKHNSADKISNRISKNIKIFKTGSSERFINQADIIIGHNSAATIEALANGKYVMVPFFEKKQIPRMYQNIDIRIRSPSEMWR